MNSAASAPPASEGDGDFKDTVPDEYRCPITCEIMSDPVVAADGQTYERHAITQWIAGGRMTSPLTGEPLKSKILIPNYLVKSNIHAYLQRKPRLEAETQIKVLCLFKRMISAHSALKLRLLLYVVVLLLLLFRRI